jgi:hypothetical protein
VRWLVIVRRDHAHLVAELRMLFPNTVDVMLDRRRGENRKKNIRVVVDRRHADRRRRMSGPDQRSWSRFGYRVARLDEGPPS